MKRALLTVLCAALLAVTTSGCRLFRALPPEYEPFTTASGVHVWDLVVPEDGPRAAEGDRVTIDYDLHLSDGTIADSSRERGRPIAFVLGAGDVPRGLEEGLVGTVLLARRRIGVPAELGYGAEGMPPRIPPDAALVFDIELVGLEKTEALSAP